MAYAISRLQLAGVQQHPLSCTRPSCVVHAPCFVATTSLHPKHRCDYHTQMANHALLSLHSFVLPRVTHVKSLPPSRLTYHTYNANVFLTYSSGERFGLLIQCLGARIHPAASTQLLPSCGILLLSNLPRMQASSSNMQVLAWYIVIRCSSRTQL